VVLLVTKDLIVGAQLNQLRTTRQIYQYIKLRVPSLTFAIVYILKIIKCVLHLFHFYHYTYYFYLLVYGIILNPSNKSSGFIIEIILRDGFRMRWCYSLFLLSYYKKQEHSGVTVPRTYST